MPTTNLPEATTWKSAAEKRQGYDFRVGSGQLCRIRSTDLQQLILDGVIDDVDAVTKLVASDIMQKKAVAPTGKNATAAAIKQSIEFLHSDDGRTAIELMNTILPHVIIAPVVLPDPADPEDRDSEAIYISDIDVNDRAEIFAEVMKGVEKAATFRE